MQEDKRLKKEVTYISLLCTFISIISCIVLEIFLFYGFLVSIVITVSLLVRNGFSLTELTTIMIKSLGEYKSLFGLIAFIGASISVWMSSGAIPAMLYYGLQYMQHTNFLLASFVLVSMVSIAMGSTIGAVCSTGIALLGLGTIFGLPNTILLGAIVSGALVGDRISPISSIFNLTIETVETSYQEAVLSMLKTLLPAYLIAGLIYYLMGKQYDIALENSNINNFIAAINSNFTISPLLLLLPISVMIMLFFGVKIVKALLINIVAGVMVSINFQQANISDCLTVMCTGYRVTTSSPELNAVLISGGILSMVPMLFIIAGAIGIGSIFQETGLIMPVIRQITSCIKSKEELIFQTGIISSTLTIIGEESIGIILPGKLLRDKFEEYRIKKVILARTISDTANSIPALIPWNVTALFISTATGVATVSYAPFAVLCYLSPIIMCVITYLKKSQKAYAGEKLHY